MDRTEVSKLLVLGIAGLLARLAVFRDVAVNGDTGLYLYDAKQLLWGRQMMVEYPSRSPLFEHALAAVIWVADSPIVGARAFMVAIGVALGVAIYAFARQLHSHRAGLVAAALYYFTPFSLIWGVWVKTEPASGLVLLAAFVLALAVIDRDRLPLHASAAIGVLFGAAFLIRRVAIVHIGAFALFVLWYRYRQHGDVRQTLTASTAVLAAAGGVLGVAYLLLARGDLALAADLFETHAAALVLSSGQGSLGWVGLESSKAVTAASTSGGGLFASICQKCGANTVGVFLRTFLVTLPVGLLTLPLLRSFLDNASDLLSDVVLPTSLGVLALLAAWRAATAGLPIRAMAGVIFATGVWYVWQGDAVPFDEFWTPKLALPVLVLVGLAAGYLYRDRILYVTYFQDLYPYFVTLAAISAVEFYDRRCTLSLRDLGSPKLSGYHAFVGFGGLLLVLATLVAGANAYPYQPDGPQEGSHWHALEDVQSHGAELEAMTAPEERVFAAQPLFAIEADRRLAADLSRKYYAFQGWPDSHKAAETEAELAAQLDSGETPVAVIDHEARWPLDRDPVREAFTENYCRADSDAFAAGGELYVYADASTNSCDTYEHTEPQR